MASAAGCSSSMSRPLRQGNQASTRETHIGQCAPCGTGARPSCSTARRSTNPRRGRSTGRPAPPAARSAACRRPPPANSALASARRPGAQERPCLPGTPLCLPGSGEQTRKLCGRACPARSGPPRSASSPAEALAGSSQRKRRPVRSVMVKWPSAGSLLASPPPSRSTATMYLGSCTSSAKLGSRSASQRNCSGASQGTYAGAAKGRKRPQRK